MDVEEIRQRIKQHEEAEQVWEHSKSPPERQAANDELMDDEGYRMAVFLLAEIETLRERVAVLEADLKQLVHVADMLLNYRQFYKEHNPDATGTPNESVFWGNLESVTRRIQRARAALGGLLTRTHRDKSRAFHDDALLAIDEFAENNPDWKARLLATEWVYLGELEPLAYELREAMSTTLEGKSLAYALFDWLSVKQGKLKGGEPEAE